MRLVPDAYYKNVFEINYDNLVKKEYKYIFFDVDNTLLTYDSKNVNEKIIKLFKNIKEKGLEPIIISNSRKNRIGIILNTLDIKGYTFSKKPLKFVYKNIINKYDKNKCIFIGDQLMTDVLGAKRNKLKVILVDRINDNEPFGTKIWRFFERKILKKYDNKKIFIVKKYYDNL